MSDLIRRPDNNSVDHSVRALVDSGVGNITSAGDNQVPITLGRQDLTYDNLDLASWGNWPSEVLSDLRQRGFGTCSTRHRYGGSATDEAEALWSVLPDPRWLVPRSRSRRKRGVRPDCRDTIARQTRGGSSRLVPLGSWTLTSVRVWPLGQGKRITWTDLRDPSRSPSPSEAVGPAEGASRAKDGSKYLKMPERFKTLLMGIPEEMQRSVLEGAVFEPTPWGNAEGWGWPDHTAGCNHTGACEHVCVAVTDGKAVLVLDVSKWDQSYWSGYVERWETEEELATATIPR